MKFGTAFERLIDLRNNPAIRAMTGAFGLRVLITIVNLGLVTLAARTLSGHDFGTYSMLFSAAGLLSVVATFGQQIFIMRSWSEYTNAGDEPKLKGAMTFTALASLAGSILIGLPFFFWVSLEQDTVLAVSTTLYLVCFALMLISAHVTRGAVGVGVSDGLTYLLVATCPMVYLAGCVISGTPIEIHTIFLTMAAASCFTVMVQMTLLRRRVHAQFPHFGRSRVAFELRTWSARSAKLWVSSCLEAANQYADVVIIDAPGSMGAAYGATIAISDLALVPSGATIMDVNGAVETVTLIRKHRKTSVRAKPDVLVIPSRIDKRTGAGKDAVVTLASLTEPVAPAISYRAAVADSLATGDTVGPGTPSAAEFASLADAIQTRLGV